MDLEIVPFWNDKIQEVSDKLFLPIPENMTKNTKSVPTLGSKTWFSTNEYCNKNTNYFDIPIQTNNTIKNIVKSKKIKLYFTTEQRYYFKQIIGTYKYFYNRCIAYFNNYDKTTRKSYFYIIKGQPLSKISIKVDDDMSPYTMISLRSQLKDKKTLPKWLLPNFPSHLIDQAFIEAFNRMATCLAVFKKTARAFKMKYKSKRDIVNTLNLEKTMISAKSFWSNWKINNKYMFRNIRMSDKIRSDIIGSSISYHKVLNTYILNMNYNDTSVPCIGSSIAAIDQGIKTPFMVYSPKSVVEIGTGSMKVINKLCGEIDIIQSIMNRKSYDVSTEKYDGMHVVTNIVTRNKKRSLRKAMHRKIKKISNLRDELHNKTVCYLTRNYKAVILPSFKTGSMVKTLSSKIARNMNTLSFFQFKQKMRSKCVERNVSLYELSEPYTSKTCGKCGNIKKNLGNASIYKCDKCHLEMSRDMNGARNILLRNRYAVK